MRERTYEQFDQRVIIHVSDRGLLRWQQEMDIIELACVDDFG